MANDYPRIPGARELREEQERSSDSGREFSSTGRKGVVYSALVGGAYRVYTLRSSLPSLGW